MISSAFGTAPLGCRSCSPGKATSSISLGRPDACGISSDICSGPCAGFVSEGDYRRRVETAAAFLEGRTLQPLDRVIRAMQEAAEAGRFELATRWRERFEQLEWLRGRDEPSAHGSRSAHLRVSRSGGLRRRSGVPRAAGCRAGFLSLSPPRPSSDEAFCAVVAEEAARPDTAERPAAARFDRRDSAVDGLVPGAPRGTSANDALLRVDQPVRCNQKRTLGP